MTFIKTIGLTAIGAFLLSQQASAHVSFVDDTVAEDSAIVAALQVPHGCDGKATTQAEVKLPEGFIAAKPQPKAGWDIEIISGNYAKTYSNHGLDVTSGPVEIRRKNGNLPDELYDTFVMQGKVSGVEPGSELAFVTTQRCGNDASAAWTEIAPKGTDAHMLKQPAPVLKIATRAEVSHDSHSGHDMSAMNHGEDAGTFTVGELSVSNAFTKAMLPGQPVGGGFFKIENKGAQDDELIEVTSPIAGRVEIHEMAMVNDVMKMRKLDNGIAIAAGQTVDLSPGGLHLMFFSVKKPFAQGDNIPVTLNFRKAGKLDITLPVSAAGPAAHQHN